MISSIDRKLAIGFAGVFGLLGGLILICWEDGSAAARAGVVTVGLLVIVVLGWVWVLVRKDSQARQRAEELLRSANDQLETGVRERTAALSRSVASLTQSEARLSKIVATAPGVIYALRLAPDGNFCFPFISPVVTQVMGLQPGDLSSTAAPLMGALHPLDADRVRSSLLASGRDLIPWREEFRIRHPHRGELWLEGNSIPEREADGGTLWYGVLRDVSERKLTEQQIRYQFHLLKSITERAAECIYVTDLQGCVTFANPEVEKVFGYALDEIVGANLHEKIHHHHPDGRPFPAAECALENALTSYNSVRNQELVFFRKDGSPVPTLCSSAPLEVAERVVGVVIVVRDITELKDAEKALRESEERLRQIAASLRDAIWLVDSQTQQVLYVNPAFETICGHTCEDFYQDAEVFNQIIHPEDRDRVLRAYFNGASMGAVEERHRIIRPDGTIRWVKSRTVAVKNVVGESYRIATILEDVTTRVEAEHLQRSLEEQLRQAQKMDAIGTLAGGIAHDFNNVLAGILGSVELARMEVPPDHSAQQFLQSILLASNRARELVQQILTFSRRKDSEKTLIQVQPVVAECVKLLRSTFPAMVRITHQVDLSCPPVLADPIQIHQVIMNICTNAWHALPPADGHIDIVLHAREVSQQDADRHADLRSGSYVCLTIKDNGHGMDLATQQRIFEPFFTTKPSGKGTGLGLSVAHGIIKSHQGALLVVSAPGQGAAFSVYLPAHTGADLNEPAAARQLLQGRGERILFVDDEPNLAVVTEKVLTRIGYAVTRFNRAEQALETFREDPYAFELVITDFAMPGMSGTDLAGAILETRGDIPVLLISGFVDQPVHDAALKIGIREVLLKPLSIEGLSDSVSRALAGARATRGG